MANRKQPGKVAAAKRPGSASMQKKSPTQSGGPKPAPLLKKSPARGAGPKPAPLQKRVPKTPGSSKPAPLQKRLGRSPSKAKTPPSPNASAMPGARKKGTSARTVVPGTNMTVGQARQRASLYASQHTPAASSKGTPIEKAVTGAVRRAANAVSGQTDAQRYKASLKRTRW